MSLFHHLVESIRVGRRPQQEETEVRPSEEDLALQILRKKYREYLQCLDVTEKEAKLFQLVPLFNKTCMRMEEKVLVDKFEEVFDFAENVAFVFVRHVTHLAQSGPIALLEYFEGDEDSPSAGVVMLKALAVLARGPETLVNSMMSSNLSSILVRCLHLFLDLPAPSSFPSTRSSASAKVRDQVQLRGDLQKLFVRLLNRLLRYNSACQDLMEFDDLSLLFGAISSPCPVHNKIWRKTASETLMTICRHNLTANVIHYIHQKGCIGFCIRNLKLAVKQPPLELVEIMVAITCCLKDSADFSQSLIDDFSSNGGYTFLLDYILQLETKGGEEALDAQRNIVLLTSDLVTCGFTMLEPNMSDPGPFQDPDFIMPIPAQTGNTVRNTDAFMVLQSSFQHSVTSHLGKTIIDVILNIYKCDAANFFILEGHHTLSSFLEILPVKNEDVQASVFLLLEYVIVNLGYVPTSALTSLGLLLDNKEHPSTLSLALNHILKFISHKASFKDVYREAGILILLINSLKSYSIEMRLQNSPERMHRGMSGSSTSPPINSPSLPIPKLEGALEECVFLLMECLRATIEGNHSNGHVFHDNGGTVCVMEMLGMKKFRRMALRLITQLIMLDGGHIHMRRLLDLLNTAKQTEVPLRTDILQTILGVFQLDSARKALFRDGDGFNYLLSVLSSLYGSLAPYRTSPWDSVPRSDILQLLQLAFTVLTTSMQDDPANRLFFETNIRFDCFSAPLRMLGCFAKEVEECPLLSTATIDQLSPSKTFLTIDSEFEALQAPPTPLSSSSVVYCASEMFRYLRDMALGVTSTQTRPLLTPPPDRRAERPSRRHHSGYLVHPGAVLCMVDLLPCLEYDLMVMESGGGIREEEMTDQLSREWCVYLQDCVLREIYTLAGPERNQQSLCQVGLPGRLLQRCRHALANESHPLHHGLERTFEKLSYQSLTPGDFRNFLRLGDPLCCALNDITEDELSDIASANEMAASASNEEEPEGYTTPPEQLTNENTGEQHEGCSTPQPTQLSMFSRLPHTAGEPLSLARIQSLVSMTTPRDGILSGFGTGACPPFVEFDMSIDGFGSLFIPSVFPQTIFQNVHTGSVSTTGFGTGGERVFPPPSGLTYTTWVCLCDVQSDEHHPINLLTLSQCFLTHKMTLASYPLLRVWVVPAQQTLYISTQIPKEKRDPEIEDYIHKDDRKEKYQEVGFPCPQLCNSSAGVWHHVTMVLQARGLRGKAKATLFVDGQPLGTPHKLPYIHTLSPAVHSQFQKFPSEFCPYLINALIGTHVDHRHISPLVYRLGPSYLFDDALPNLAVSRIYKLGPNYLGSFQNPGHGSVSSPGFHEAPAGCLIPEDKLVFGLVADKPSNHTLAELVNKYAYSVHDATTIGRELSLTDQDEVTPITLLSNGVLHLSGPARSVGAIVCGYSGIRTFEPQPLRNLLSAVGGTSVVLGLVAMANNVDSLYASMKAMVCIVGNSVVALKEMERTGGFQLLGMLLRSKSKLVNSNILHLTYTLVGTVSSEHESACIPNKIAFRDLLADQSVWCDTSQEIQRSLCQHFHELLTHSNDQNANAFVMLSYKLIPELLMRLHDDQLLDSTIKAIINVLSALMSHEPSSEDIRRFGQLLVFCLSRESVAENKVVLYPGPDDQDEEGMSSDTPTCVRRRVRLRNLLLDVLMSHFTTEHNEFDTKFVHLVCDTLGFDWLLLFLQTQVHLDTVVRALRMLVLLLSDPSLRKRFVVGDIFGGWLSGMQNTLPEYTKERQRHLHFSLSSSHRPDIQLQGILCLARLLPNHLESAQTFHLVIALMLGVSVTEVPYTAGLDLESLDSIFGVGRSTKGSRLASGNMCLEAVFILLSMVRVLLHQDGCHGDRKALVLLKFLEQVYHNVPKFQSQVAHSQEFIEALVGTLFPPSTPLRLEDLKVESEENGFLVLGAESESTATTSSSTTSQATPTNTQPALLRGSNSSPVMNVIKLFRIIAVDGFAKLHPTQRQATPYECPILETILYACPSEVSADLHKNLQTVVLQAIMKHLEGGNEDVVVILKNAGPLAKTAVGLSVFCSRLVDKLWLGEYVKPSESIYNLLLKLVEQALAKPKLLPLADIQRALNRVVLYQLSVVPQNELEQKELVETLCLLSSQAHIIFDETNQDTQFVQCLLLRLLKLAFTDQQHGYLKGLSPPTSPAAEGRIHGGYTPIISSSLLRSGANRLWSKMLEYKRRTLEAFLDISLPVPATRSSLPSTIPGATPTGSLATASVYNVSSGNPAHTKLQNCRDFLTDSLESVWRDYNSWEQSNKGADTDSTKDKGLLSTLWRRRGTGRVSERDVGLQVNEYVSIHGPQLITTAHKYEDSIQRKHQRRLDYRLRFTASEWACIEHELTRERGLWGPETPSPLDRWMLDSMEGPSRMRKRLYQDYQFYEHYPSDPAVIIKYSRHQKAASFCTPLYLARRQLFSHSTCLSQSASTIPHGHIEMTRARQDSLTASYRKTETTDSPLSPATDLLSTLDHEDPVARALFKMVDLNDKITEHYQCARLTGLDSYDGLLMFGSTHFYIVEGITITKSGSVVDLESASEGSYDPVIPSHLTANTLKMEGSVAISCTKWLYNSIREVHKRRYLLRHCAFEVFSNDGQALFLISHLPQRDKIYQKLFSLARPADQEQVLLIDPDMNPEHGSGFFSAITGKRTLTQRWENGEMSNFQYLMHLNTLAGRSYNDLMQYPIFPWVIADYDSSVLDLSDPKTYRDFSKPMGAQSAKRLNNFQERYRNFTDPMGETDKPYYYGTHFSSAMSVASFLIRIEPFTQHLIKLQGGHFDLPDRMFHSIPEAWRSASETNMADVKELIPEFFYLPDFLTNKNQFDLGVKQNLERLDDIVMPPWAKGDPHEFIRLHREALESDYVSAHLHQWIDLIFGFKQTGKAAEQAHNIFHPLFYEGTVDIDTIEDPVQRNAAISFIHNFGQMPRQLFKKTHRPRKVFTGTTALANPTTDGALLYIAPVFFKNVLQLMPSKESVKEIRGDVGQMVTLSDKLLCAEKRKLLLPPNYTRYFSWGYMDQSSRIAMVEQDKLVTVYEGLQQGKIMCAAALDDFTLLTAGDSTVVYVWSVKGSGPKDRSPKHLQLKHTLHGHTGAVTCLATSASYNLIVSGSKDKTCILWDSIRLLFVRQLRGHNSSVNIVTINQLTGNIVSCTRNEIKLWTVNGELLASTELAITANNRLLCCTMSEMLEWDTDNVIVTGSSDGIVRLWRLEYQRVDSTPYSDMFSRRTSNNTTVSDTMSLSSSRSHVVPGRPVRPDKRADQVTAGSSMPTSDDDTLDQIEVGVATDGSDIPAFLSERIESSDTESSEAQARQREEEDEDEEGDQMSVFSQQEEAEASQEAQASPVLDSGEALMKEYVEEASRRAKELKEKTGDWVRRIVLASTLTMHTSYHRDDNTSPAAVTCLAISKDHRKLFVGDARGRVFSWSVADTLGAVMEHWVQDDYVTRCKCGVEFTFSDRKHHCRSCGNIFCSKCSDYQSEVPKLGITKKVRVCQDCFEREKNSLAKKPS